MRRAIAGLAALGVGASLVVAAGLPAGAAPPPGSAPTVEPAAAPPGPDELPNPLEDKRRELRQEALTAVVNGEATPTEVDGSTVVQVGEQAGANDSSTQRSGQGGRGGRTPKDQYVELSRETTDRVFVLLVEFGDERHPDYPDQDTSVDTPGPARFDGPLHNEIPEPDRTVDNSTIWEPDYSRDYFQDLYFGAGDGGAAATESMRSYYETQSSGRYSIDGQTSDWVKVPYNEARYGRSDGYPCDDSVCDNTWALVQDGMNQWLADQQAAGVSDAEIAETLASYDVWDRYDFDGDGDFNEPDGYIDHLQIVHAGGDQADGDPWQGEDAIWSHRWYAYVSDVGMTGPAENLLGGTQVGATGVWVGDYTVQPENGGLSTFAHEYGHDLGLPDHYDTAGGGENGVEWWTLMAQSRLSAEGEPIGTRAGDLSAWDKLQLGWLDYEVAVAGQDRTLRLGPSEYNTGQAPGGRRRCCRRRRSPSTTAHRSPASASGGRAQGDNLSNIDDPDGRPDRQPRPASLDLQGRFDIEADYDYLYVAGVHRRRHLVDHPRRHRRRRAVRAGRQRPARHLGLVGRRVARRERAARRLRRRAGRRSGSSTGPTAASPPTASSPTRSR